jgi:hypothetical protein
MNFREIVGEYSNQSQAFMYPCDYAMVRLVWEDLGVGNRLRSRSFKEYDYPNVEPYRESLHTYEMISDDEVLFNTYDPEWNLLCTHNIYWDGEFWVYRPCDDCIVNDIKIISEIKFNKQKYYGRDAGYDVDGNLVWGKETGMFEFDRCEISSAVERLPSK